MTAVAVYVSYVDESVTIQATARFSFHSVSLLSRLQ
jgi:hypothetical protein